MNDDIVECILNGEIRRGQNMRKINFYKNCMVVKYEFPFRNIMTACPRRLYLRKNETIISTVQKPYNIIMYNSEYGSFTSGL